MKKIASRKKKLYDNLSATIDFDLNLETLDQIINYLFSATEDNTYITRKSLSNIRDLFRILDKRPYETEEPLMARISFIESVLELELNDYIFSYDLLISKGLEGNYKDEIQNSIIPFLENTSCLNNEEIKYINKFITDRLEHYYIFKYKSEIFSLYDDMSLNKYTSLHDINLNFKRVFTNFQMDIRRCDLNKVESGDLDFSDPNIKDDLFEVITQIKRPTKFIKSGLIKFNEMTGGGFECGRLYLFAAVSGGFKSGFLLNILYWVKKYNTNYQPNDPTKIPTILYITQENSMTETIERLWGICFPDIDIPNLSQNEMIDMLLGEDSILAVNEKSPINIVLKYRSNKTIRTSDLYNMYDDLYEDGKEVILVIHDYTKRILPVYPTSDPRIDLGNVIDEETVFAKAKNIPFITAAQLNRKAMELVEETTSKGKTNAIDKLASSNIGESWNMIENADWVGLLYKQSLKKDAHNPDSPTEEIISIKQAKHRGQKKRNLITFTQPFYNNSTIRILDDVELGKPMAIGSLEETSSPESIKGSRKGRKVTDNKERDKKLSQMMLDDDLDDFDDL